MTRALGADVLTAEFHFMRRVDRGPHPPDDGANPKRFHPYNKAKSDLLQRIGGYCSYCERTGDLHVEHVVPGRHRPDLEEEWDNFLLGCTNCNGTKGDRNHSRDDYLWPDQHDTEAAFEYLPDGIVKVRHDLPEPTRARATRLFDLVGLGRRPAADPRARDLRWRKRREAWGQAEEARRRIEEGADAVDCVVRLAMAVGFWSVWMTVFAAHPGSERSPPTELSGHEMKGQRLRVLPKESRLRRSLPANHARTRAPAVLTGPT